MMLSLPAVLLISFVLIIPVLWLFWLSIYEDGQFTLANYERMLSGDVYYVVFRDTFWVAFLVTGLCIALGYPLCYAISKLPPRWAALCLALCLLPFWTPILVRTYAWIVLLQSTGPIVGTLRWTGLFETPPQLLHNFTGTIIGMVHIVLPFMILPLVAAMQSIDGSYVRAASSLGATPARAFWTVFVPLSLPGLFAGALLVFIYCLGFYIMPSLMGGGRVILVSMVIWQNAALHSSWGAASAPSVVLLCLTLALFYAINRVLPVGRWLR